MLAGAAGRRWSIPGEPRVAEHFQPVRVGFARQQFRRALADAFGSLTPQEAAMIEEELEQGQIVRPQMAAEEEIVSEPAVKVLDYRTGAGCAIGQFSDGHTELKETVAESLAQRGLAWPARG